MDEQRDIPKIIKRRLCDRTPLNMPDSRDRIHAAVLMPLFFDGKIYRLVFTKRTGTVGSHKGQVSFPGGAVDRGDKSFLDAALREAEEEIGLAGKDVTLLGRTDDIQTKSTSFTVHPFMGTIPHPYEFRTSPDEVERVFSVPLPVFFSEDSPNRTMDAEWNGVVHPGVAWWYENELIWGATARIITNFIQIMDGWLEGSF